MSKSSKLHANKPSITLKHIPTTVKQCYVHYWQKNLWHKVLVMAVLFISLALGSMYGIARWYIWQQSSKPLSLGVSFIPNYAQQLGLNPKTTLDAILQDLDVKHLRLVSYWDDIEAKKGQYNFSELDWELQKANMAHAKVSLAIGLRQPRWPECHVPTWVSVEPTNIWQPQLQTFIGAVVERYKNNPAIESYQLENEYFLRAFGQCTNYDRQRLVNEFDLVKKLDPYHTIIIARSNNALGLPIGEPVPDEFGVSIYKRVWDQTIIHRYVEYPFPAWFYAYLAGAGEILTGKNMIIHELQAEPWPPYGSDVTKVSITEQDKSLDAKRLKTRFSYGKATGIRNMDLWGAEFWYYRKEKLRDPSFWNVAKQEFAKSANSTD